MFVFRRGRGGSKYTLISIIMILAVLYAYRYTMPRKDVEYPQYINYRGSIYEYTVSTGSSPVLFKRLKGASDEGYMVLVRRSSANSGTLSELYIYEGFLQYRKYVIKNE